MLINLKTKTKILLFLVTKSTDTLNQHTQTKSQGILENRLAKSRQSFSFHIPIKLKDEEWILNSTKLEVYNSSFVLKNENNKFELFKPVEKKENC